MSAAASEYLYRSKRIPKGVKKLVDFFNAHPVLVMKNGRITLKTILFGNYDKASMRYVRRELKHPDRFDDNPVFITHAGCPLKKLERVKAEVARRLPDKGIIVTKASATISSSCGPDTFGVLFIRKTNY